MQNQLLKGFLLSVSVFILLVAYPWVHEQVSFLNNNFKQVNVLPFLKSNLTKNNQLKEELVLQNRIDFIKSFKDEMAFQAHRDSLLAIKNYTGSQSGLIHFFQSLLNTEKGKAGTTRIGYFGDSMIEGDLITKSLREWFQKNFGGRGIGFMPITSITSGFRTNIKHEFSDNWQYASLVVGNPTHFAVGLSGEIFYADSFPSVANFTYTAVNQLYLEDFPLIKFFYGTNDSIEKTTFNTLIFKEEKYLLEEKAEVNTLKFKEENLTKVEFSVEFNYPMPIYGVSFESKSGVLIDNFSSRANSGMPLYTISEEILQGFNKEMEYDLIVLQFGMNVLSGKTNYIWYKKGMKRVVNHFKKSFPNTSILLVSVADKSTKTESGEMQTDPAIPLIVEIQRETALETEVAFFNLYEKMGGDNSMVKWAEELGFANKDYTHFNQKGAEAAASLLYDFLIKEYTIFKTSTQKKNDI
jgi:lysophospholipase L1-like esterase